MTREQYLNQRNQLMAQAKSFLDAGDIEKFNAKKAEVEALDNKYEAEAQAQANYVALQGGAVVPAGLQNLGAGAPAGQGNAVTDPYDTDEYKAAFMNFCARSQSIPAKFRNAAENTTSADVPAAIPTTWANEIIRNLRERGVIFQQLRHMNIAGGVEIPVLDLAPVATWVGDTASEDKKLTASTTVSFKYFGLECKISQSLLVGAVTIDAFQQLFVELATEAVFTAVEKGVFNGKGTGQMLGICKDTRITNAVEMTADEFGKWDAWKKKVFAKIPKRYQNGKFFMAQGSFEGYIDGMVDQFGQPVGRVNYGISSAPEYRFGGKKVDTVEEDIISSFEAASAGEVVAFSGIADINIIE